MVQFNPDFSPKSPIPPELQAKLEQLFQQQFAPGLAGFQAAADQAAEEYNNTPQAKIGGFSPSLLLALERHPLNPFELWGLVEIERIEKGYRSSPKRLQKTKLLDRFITFKLQTKF